MRSVITCKHEGIWRLSDVLRQVSCQDLFHWLWDHHGSNLVDFGRPVVQPAPHLRHRLLHLYAVTEEIAIRSAQGDGLPPSESSIGKDIDEGPSSPAGPTIACVLCRVMLDTLLTSEQRGVHFA